MWYNSHTPWTGMERADKAMPTSNLSHIHVFATYVLVVLYRWSLIIDDQTKITFDSTNWLCLVIYYNKKIHTWPFCDLLFTFCNFATRNMQFQTIQLDSTCMWRTKKQSVSAKLENLKYTLKMSKAVKMNVLSGPVVVRYWTMHVNGKLQVLSSTRIS